MGPRSLLLLLLLATSLHADLGPARRLLPPSHGVLPFRDIDRPVHSDGTNFLVVLNAPLTASDNEPLRQVLLVGPDGTQLTRPLVLRQGFFSAGWAGNYILRSGSVYQRLASDGTLLDATPRALPPIGPTRFAAASTTAYLMVDGGNFGALIHPNGDHTILRNLPGGGIEAIATNGPDFAITYKPNAVDSWVRVINDRGETLHDRELGYRMWLTSDRTSYLVNPSPDDASAPYRILDRDLNLKRTVERTFGQGFRAIGGFGRGYSSVRGIFPWTGTVLLTEIRGPEYVTETGIVDIGINGIVSQLPYELFGNPHALLVLKGRTAYLAKSVWEVSAPPTQLKFRGALDRERPTSATNANGVSLVVWQESPDLQGRVYAARVSPGGALLDAAPLPIAPEGCSDLRTSVATDGTDFLVGWSGCTEVGASLVSAAGGVTPSFTRQRAGVPGNHSASVVWDGETYVFAWSVANATAIARVLPAGAATLPPFSLNVRNAMLAPLPNGELMAVHHGEIATDVFAQRVTRELRPAGGTFFVTPSATIRTLTRVGDRVLLTAHGSDGYTYAIALDFQAQTVGAKARIAGARDSRVWCAGECAIVWKDIASPAIVGVTASVGNGVAIGAPVVVSRYEKDYPVGEPVLLRGSLAQPALLLYTAPDPVDGGLQLFARASTQKRRAVRP